jgi:hypothetical protein
VLIDMVVMGVMQVSIVEIVSVTLMENRPMAAAGGMHVRMLVMNHMVAHRMTPC